MGGLYIGGVLLFCPSLCSTDFSHLHFFFPLLNSMLCVGEKERGALGQGLMAYLSF